MPKYEMPVPTRQQWQRLRDAAKVPAGISKANVGEALDAVHKSFSLPTMSKHQQAVVQLQRDVETYLVVAKKRYPSFEPVVNRELKKRVQLHLRFVEDQLKAKTEFYPRYQAVLEARSKVSAGTAAPKDVARALERLLGCAAAFALVDPTRWDPRRQGLNRIMSEFERAPTITPGHRAALDKLLAELKPS